MGVLTRQQGPQYIISSDLDQEPKGNKRAPRALSDVYQVWTGSHWSTNQADALCFDSLDEADEYVRVNYNLVLAKRES